MNNNNCKNCDKVVHRHSSELTVKVYIGKLARNAEKFCSVKCANEWGNPANGEGKGD